MAIAQKESEELYLKDYRTLESRQAATAPEWLGKLRSEGIQSFAELGFPTTRLEDWKYCNVAPIASVHFQPAPFELSNQVREQVEEMAFAEADCTRLVFVNGHYAEELSAVGNLPKGATVTNLAKALKQEGSITAQLGRYAGHNCRSAAKHHHHPAGTI